MQLSNLTKLVKKRKRIGRGGSRGGTSGRGSKGQKARSGPTLGIIFEGGQMPISRRLPKRGFNNFNFRKKYEIVNVEDLERLFASGENVDKDIFVEKGVLKSANSLVKILGSGELSKKLVVTADAFSSSAKQLIEKCGGKAHLTKEK